MKQWIVTIVSLVVMGVGSTVLGYFEDRVRCTVLDSHVQVALYDGTIRCFDLQDRIQEQVSLIDGYVSQSQSHFRYAQTPEERKYWSSLMADYVGQRDRLLSLHDSVDRAMVAFELKVLVQFQGYLHTSFVVDKALCRSVWPTFKPLHLSTRSPVCWLGQERQINTMQQTKDLDEFVVFLREYVRRRNDVLASQ